MNDLLKYIQKYGDLTFDEKPVGEVDIVIFSQIPYLDFSNIFKSKKECIKLSEVWNIAAKQNINLIVDHQKSAFKIMDILSTKKRYKDILLKNYVYVLEKDTQFGAITLIIPNMFTCVSFEGTDGTLWGWKEDFKLTYTYPTPSQKLAAKYLNKTIKFFGPEVLVCGHSKGGNLALVGSMKTNFWKKHKIKKIYSLDGPGLRDKEFNSVNYKLIKDKLINIIPNSSLVGILLEQENLTVIKSKRLGLLQHDVNTWAVEEDKLKRAVQDKMSERLDESISQWLSKHNYKEREEIIEGIFGMLEDAGIDNFYDVKVNMLDSLYKIIKSSIDMEKETRDIILNSIKLLATDFSNDIINDSKAEIKETIEKIKSKIV